MIYLASPYTHESKHVEFQRFREMCYVTGKLQASGHHVFSPIVHSHPVVGAVQLPTTFEWWMSYNKAWIDVCQELWVVMLDGWDKSKGVGAEILYCGERGIPVRYFDPRPSVFGLVEEPKGGADN